MIKLIEAVTNRMFFVVRKPKTVMIEYILNRFKFNKKKIAIFGDRLYTDIKMIEITNINSILVLS